MSASRCTAPCARVPSRNGMSIFGERSRTLAFAGILHARSCGPPELSKLLWEARLLRERYRTLREVIATPASKIAESIHRMLERKRQLRDKIVSIGLPILTPAGDRMVRGPRINIPSGKKEPVRSSKRAIDTWARKGWVDLRPANFERWRERFRKIQRAGIRLQQGSAAVTREAYLSEEIVEGEIVAWIFSNEEGGYRLK